MKTPTTTIQWLLVFGALLGADVSGAVAANQIKIDQVNSSGTAWVSQIFNTGNNSLLGTSGSGVPSLVTVGSGLTLSGGAISATFNGTVTNVAMTVPSFLSVAGSPITTTGTFAVTLSGTALPVANGGTGLTTIAANSLLYASASNTYAGITPAASSVLVSDGSNVPSWATTLPAVNGSAVTNLNGSAVASGTVPAANLGSGSSITTKFLRGDNTWQALPGGGDLLAANNLADVASATTSQGNLVVGGGASSTRVGVSALSAGTQATALGNSASAAGNLSVVVGYSSTTLAGASGQGAVVVGYNIDNVGSDSTAIGYQATAAGTTLTAVGSGASGGSRAGSAENVAIGDDAKVRDDLAVADLSGIVLVGRQPSSQSNDSIVIGHSADIGKSAPSSIAIGSNAQIADNFQDSIVIGRDATATAASQFVIGSDTAPIRNFYWGGGVASAGTPLGVKFNWANATGSNISTPDAEFNGGKSTGTGTGGRFIFQTTSPGASGSSANSLATRFVIEQSTQKGADFDLPEGYTGSGLAYGVDVQNAAASTGTTIFSGFASLAGNVGIVGRSSHSGLTSANLGTFSHASGGRPNVGAVGSAVDSQENEAAAISVGAYGAALRAHASAVHVGVAAFTATGTPTFESAALLADNGTQTTPIASFRDNGTTVWSIIDGGSLEGTVVSTPSAPAASKGRLYFDTSGGKVRLVVLFPSGAAQVIATEP